MTEMTNPAARVIRLLPDGPPGQGLEPIELDPADFESDLPEQRWYIAYSDPAIGLNVGVWETTDMQEAFGPYPGDEFILVIEGDFEMLDGDGNATPARQGQSAIFRNGAPMSWLQKGRLKKYFITLADPNAEAVSLPGAEGGFRVLGPDAAPGPGAAETRSASGAIQRDETLWINDAGTMEIGIWETGAWTSEPFALDHHEFVQVLDGSVAITLPDGATDTFEAGDVFFMPGGTVATWHAPDGVRKYYAAVEAKGPSA